MVSTLDHPQTRLGETIYDESWTTDTKKTEHCQPESGKIKLWCFSFWCKFGNSKEPLLLPSAFLIGECRNKAAKLWLQSHILSDGVSWSVIFCSRPLFSDHQLPFSMLPIAHEHPKNQNLNVLLWLCSQRHWHETSKSCTSCPLIVVTTMPVATPWSAAWPNLPGLWWPDKKASMFPHNTPINILVLSPPSRGSLLLAGAHDDHGIVAPVRCWMCWERKRQAATIPVVLPLSRAPLDRLDRFSVNASPFPCHRHPGWPDLPQLPAKKKTHSRTDQLPTRFPVEGALCNEKSP